MLEHVHGPVTTHRPPVYPLPRPHPTPLARQHLENTPNQGGGIYISAEEELLVQPHGESVFRACTGPDPPGKQDKSKAGG